MKRIVFAFALLITSLSFASLTDGLVGYWPFDGDAKDYSGNGNNGNLHGVSFTNGRRGSSSAVHFDGNDYVSVPSSGKISRIFDFSVTAWMKINRYETASDGTKWCSFVSKGGDSIRQFGVQFGVNTNGAAFYQLVAGDRISCPKIPINTWTHIAVTRSGLNASLYINGVGVAGGTSKSYPEQHSGNLEIGRDSPGEVEYFHGEMSDVCLFNRALSAAEVSAIYNGGLKLGKVVFNANAVEVEGTMPSLSVLSGTQEKLPENAFRRHDGYVFQGWAKSKSDADNGIVEYQDEEEITIESDMTLYAVWQASLPDVVVHFNANGGVFKNRKTGEKVNEFDQCFVYGEPQRLFTDELTPLKPDGNGNQFLGWVRGTPNVYSDSDIIDGREEETFYEYDGTETTYYAVWSYTMKVVFCNSGHDLVPASLADHLKWCVVSDGDKWFRSGDSVQVAPGQQVLFLDYDATYGWVVGEFKIDSTYAPYYNSLTRRLTLDISNDYRDKLVNPTPSEDGSSIYVNVEPTGEGELRFAYSYGIREGLRNFIKAEDVPFNASKVQISVGKAEVNESGLIVPAKMSGDLTALELNKFYPLPAGFYYLKNVTYAADTGSGAPYWGPVLDSRFENQLFEVKDGRITERTINFDVFGGNPVVRVELNPNGGKCAKTEMWFTYVETGDVYPSKARIDKKLPDPEERADVKFTGWFTTPTGSGGRKMKEGDVLEGDCTLFARWTAMTQEWLDGHSQIASASNGDIATAAAMSAANGCRTVGECYALGINPEDPNDDLKIADFKMEGGKPVITLNHTEDGSGNSFEDRVKILGKAELTDAEWQEVPPEGNPAHRFFKVGVEMP